MGPRRTVLLTAFEPFGGDATNASELAVRALDARVIADHRVSVAVLPCRFGAAADALRAALARESPVLVIACGEAGGRAEISLERVAINVDDARIPDNAGAQPIDTAIVPGGPAAYWSTLPIKAMALALAQANIPAAVSQTAGTFVCNHAFYVLMHALAGNADVRAGFVHVPCTPAQAKPRQPSMATETTTRALEIVIATALSTREDTRIGGGATH